CGAPTDSIDAAISLAATVAPADAKILVVSDRAPESALLPGKIEWRAFGQAVGNLAIVHASRTYQGEKDRLLLEAANKSKQPRRLQLTLLDARDGKVLRQMDEMLQAGETFRVRSTVPEGIDTIDVRLASDPLAIDNRLLLLSPSRRLVRVGLGSLETGLRPKVRRAVEASGIARIVEESPEIVFTDGSAEAAVDAAGVPIWTVRFYVGGAGDEQAFIGPFVLDRSSPLTMGLSLDGVVWTATEDVHLPGTPIISAGDVPLLTEQTLRDGGKEYRLAYRDRLSTFSTQAAWPALIWNILKYRADQAGGMVSPNLRLGNDAVFIASARDKSIEWTEPDGVRRTIPVRGGQASMETRQCGLHTVKASSGEYAFSVGTLSTEESDLTGTSSGTFGGWNDEATVRTDYRSIVWALLLGVLTLLAAHLALVRKRG
ncbi:MAG TPA: hypothetical protein DEB39_00560, partial [Planctomycetaceae bacterium]|nr:hypothetical protein [Planctomycetaceae bacterium]